MYRQGSEISNFNTVKMNLNHRSDTPICIVKENLRSTFDTDLDIVEVNLFSVRHKADSDLGFFLSNLSKK